MNLEAPQVVVDLTQDDTWNQWEWMSRYRIWEANREVFLYPENWLIESAAAQPHRDLPDLRAGGAPGRKAPPTTSRPSCSTTSTGSTGSPICVVTGTCRGPGDGRHLRRRADRRRPADLLLPLVFATARGTDGRRSRSTSRHTRSFPRSTGDGCACSGSSVKVANEPHQTLRPPQVSSATRPDRRPVRRDRRRTSASTATTAGRPPQASKGKLFDKPLLETDTYCQRREDVEALYTLEGAIARTDGQATERNLWVDVFRFGQIRVRLALGESRRFVLTTSTTTGRRPSRAARSSTAGSATSNCSKLGHLPGADRPGGHDLRVECDLLDARPGDLRHRRAAALAAPRAAADPDLVSDSALVPQAGALAIPAGRPVGGGPSQTLAAQLHLGQRA